MSQPNFIDIDGRRYLWLNRMGKPSVKRRASARA